jgi:hypothetical protein
MKEIVTFIGDFFRHVMQEHPEHVLFYILNSFLIIMVLIRNKEAFKKGLEGANGLWEAPEAVLYIWMWMFPFSVNAVLFLTLDPPDMFWYFMLFCLLFALAGKEGITMLFNWRGVQAPQKKDDAGTPQN